MQSGSWAVGDFNGDTVVNDKDAAILAAHWGYDTSERATVPEPGSMLMLVTAVCLLPLLRFRPLLFPLWIERSLFQGAEQPAAEFGLAQQDALQKHETIRMVAFVSAGLPLPVSQFRALRIMIDNAVLKPAAVGVRAFGLSTQHCP